MSYVEILLSHIRLVQSVVEQEVFVTYSQVHQLPRGVVVSVMVPMLHDRSQVSKQENIHQDLVSRNSVYSWIRLSQVL